MKKIYSFVAALVVAMTVLVSCASENAKNISAMTEAVEAKDAAKAEEFAAKLYSVKDQLTTDEACGLAAGYLKIAEVLGENAEAEKLADLKAKAVEIVDATVAKDAEGVKKFGEAANNDLVAAVQTIKDAQAAAAKKAAEEAAAQAAEAAAEAAEAAEGKAE